MNLRILKKLSKRAAPYLERIGDQRTMFIAQKGENLSGVVVKDWPRRAKRTVYMEVLKGTVMVGETSGYYEPEWDEETAWEALREWVTWQFFEYDPKTDIAVFTRTFSTSSEVFQIADELLN